MQLLPVQPHVKTIVKRIEDWRGTDIVITSNKPIKDYGEYPAQEFKSDWTYAGKWQIKTIVHLIAKENKLIYFYGSHQVADLKGPGKIYDFMKTIDLNPESEKILAAFKTVQKNSSDSKAKRALVVAKRVERVSLFTRTNSPAFTLEYPKGMSNLPMMPGMIFRTTGGGLTLSMSISDLNPDSEPEQVLREYVQGISASFKGLGTDVEVLTNKPINTYGEF
ncbi:MAG: hypothetical protein HQ517_05315 [SAR324 cluster bacterium]|nr:hypothetical protein [SAR324 cluster bacterium]